MLGNYPMNTHLPWLKQAVHLAYPEILGETTVRLWSAKTKNITPSVSHKLLCEGFMLFIPCSTTWLKTSSLFISPQISNVHFPI